jgi:hypothetical protein
LVTKVSSPFTFLLIFLSNPVIHELAFALSRGPHGVPPLCFAGWTSGERHFVLCQLWTLTPLLAGL